VRSLFWKWSAKGREKVKGKEDKEVKSKIWKEKWESERKVG
jgi:hypothetical protein